MPLKQVLNRNTIRLLQNIQGTIQGDLIDSSRSGDTGMMHLKSNYISCIKDLADNCDNCKIRTLGDKGISASLWRVRFTSLQLSLKSETMSTITMDRRNSDIDVLAE